MTDPIDQIDSIRRHLRKKIYEAGQASNDGNEQHASSILYDAMMYTIDRLDIISDRLRVGAR